MNYPKTGDESTCQVCGERIRWLVALWLHESLNPKPPHEAIPIKEQSKEMDAFFNEFVPDEAWLLAALEAVRAGNSVRITAVWIDSGPNTKTKLLTQPEATDMSITCRGAGDITKESWLKGESK